ncbi:MAG: diaminopimelate epimerase [Actinobacteria bacterium]|nr:diaminopimelate epimerase [Actinomycetota bacterium]
MGHVLRMRSPTAFSKWHALGNAYLVIERADPMRPLASEDVVRFCDPHYGAGADGVVEVVSTTAESAQVLIWNPDGSSAELSGNGTRIAARWLAEREGVREVRIAVGPRVTIVRMGDGDTVEQELGPVRVDPPELLDVDGDEVELTPVSVGNPHAVIRREPERRELLRLGPLVERHARFPGRTNVQLVRLDGPHELRVGVWERGARETLSSGTSAVAAAAAAVANGWCTSPVAVELAGGILHVALAGERATLTGPAEEILRGFLL